MCRPPPRCETLDAAMMGRLMAFGLGLLLVVSLVGCMGLAKALDAVAEQQARRQRARDRAATRYHRPGGIPEEERRRGTEMRRRGAEKQRSEAEEMRSRADEMCRRAMAEERQGAEEACRVLEMYPTCATLIEVWRDAKPPRKDKLNDEMPKECWQVLTKPKPKPKAKAKAKP